MKNKIITVICILIFFSQIANAEINLTINSENELNIKVLSLSSSNNYSLNNSETKNITYDNYVINLYPDYKTLSNETILHNVAIFNDDRYMFIGIVLIFVIVYIVYRLIKNGM